MGSVINPSLNYGPSLFIAKFLVKKINETITNPNKKFIVLTDKSYDVKYTLKYFCEKSKINYNLIEITGQKNKQPLKLRKKQTNIIIKELFNYFKIL